MLNGGDRVFAKIAISSLLLIGLTQSSPRSQSGTLFTPTACRVIEAAYAAAVESKVAVYPAHIRRSTRSLELKEFVPDYRARLALDVGEFEDLAAREGQYDRVAFQPRCDWQGKAVRMIDEERHPIVVSFTNPIFSTNGRLALVEASFMTQGRFGYGMLCIARTTGGAWSAHCQDSWIS